MATADDDAMTTEHEDHGWLQPGGSLRGRGARRNVFYSFTTTSAMQAALESLGYDTDDMVAAMEKLTPPQLQALFDLAVHPSAFGVPKPTDLGGEEFVALGKSFAQSIMETRARAAEEESKEKDRKVPVTVAMIGLAGVIIGAIGMKLLGLA